MAFELASPERVEPVAEREWRRASSLAWPGLAAGNLIQGYLLERKVTPWLFGFTLALILSGLAAWLLNRMHFRLNFIPVIATLCIAPIVVGDAPSGSWTSIGLTIFAATIYFASIRRIWVAVATNTSLVGLQTWIASLQLTSVSDSQDMLYGFGYFSIVWTLSIGLASIWISHRYFKTADQITDLISEKMQSQSNYFKSLKQINERDSRNQRLHGTVLNTLIAIEKSWISGDDAKREFQGLIKNLDESTTTLLSDSKDSFGEMVEDLIRNRPFKSISDIKIDISKDIDDAQVKEGTLEIIREFLLNMEKHTKAQELSIALKIQKNQMISVVFIDDALVNLDKLQYEEKINEPLKSRTLNVLLSSFNAKIATNKIDKSGKRLTKIDIPSVNLDQEFQTTLKSIRFTGIYEVVNGYGKAVLLSAILSFFGYALDSSDKTALGATALTIIFFYLALRKGVQYFWLVLATTSSMLLLPMFATPFEDCNQVTLLPWVFNMVLGLAFLFTLYTKFWAVRWIPVMALLVESIQISNSFDLKCQNILLGSIPAIPLLIAISAVIIRIREREYKFDEKYVKEIKSAATKISEVDLFKNNQFELLIQSVQSDLERMLELESQEELKLECRNLIQKIRIFLTFDEHFESTLMRDLYLGIKRKSLHFQELRFSIYGSQFQRFDGTIEAAYVLQKISELTGHGQSEITFVQSDNFEVNISGQYQSSQTLADPNFENLVFRL